MNKNGLLEIIAAHRTGDYLDEVMINDKDYQEALVQQNEAFAMLEKLGLSREQKGIVDQAITANNHIGAVWRMGSSFDWRWKRLCSFRSNDMLRC